MDIAAEKEFRNDLLEKIQKSADSKVIDQNKLEKRLERKLEKKLEAEIMKRIE